ncbi:MAG: HNH endonuclease [Armatimonadetes bacterium]|nr:HNH endonuclease [Armatimonadota bacterium]
MGLLRAVSSVVYLALVSTRINADIGNKGFAAKAAEYSKSQFVLTRALSELSGWGAEEITARQKELAKLAVRAWPR